MTTLVERLTRERDEALMELRAQRKRNNVLELLAERDRFAHANRVQAEEILELRRQIEELIQPQTDRR